MSDNIPQPTQAPIGEATGAIAGTGALYAASQTQLAKKLGTRVAQTKPAQATKKAYNAVSNAVSSAIGSVIPNAVKTAVSKALATNIYKNITVGKVLGFAAGSVVDVAFAAQGIADITAKKGTSDLNKGTKIAGEVGGLVANLVLNALTGFLFAIFQMVLMMLDMLWNPFKNYYNEDLLPIKELIEKEMKKQFNENNMNWPLETKPNFLESVFDPKHPDYKKNYDLYWDLRNKYFNDNGLITKEEVLAEEKSLFSDVLSLRKMRRIYFSDGESTTLLDPISATVSISDMANMNMLELLPLAVRAKRIKEKGLQYRKTFFNKIQDFLSVNFPIFISSFLIIIFLSVVIIKYIKDNVEI